jgi:hypothetical protein
MGQKTDSAFETTEMFRGNRRSTGKSTATAYLKVVVDALPHCGHETTFLCLLEGKFKAEMPSQGQGSIQIPVWDQVGSENERPRSQPIPITKIKMAVSNDSDESEDNMLSYDLATWRMYDRIVVHRMMHPINLSESVANGVGRQASDIATPHGRFHSSDIGKLSSCEMVNPMPIPDSNYYLEGEVFELEL